MPIVRILTDVLADEPSDTAPPVVTENGDPGVQYPPPDEDPRVRYVLAVSIVFLVNTGEMGRAGHCLPRN